MQLYTYIKNCSESIINFNPEEKKLEDEKYIFQDEIDLYDCIKNLLDELNRRSKKVTSIDYNKVETDDKPNFFNLYKDESEKLCIESNKRLQSVFLIFIIKIMRNFMENIFFQKEKNKKDNENDSSNKDSRNTQKSEEEQKRQFAQKAGKIFKEKFMDSSKYNSFIINFCKFQETIDLYKIPYNFINEFIYYSQFEKRLNETFIFKVIDQFYGKTKSIDFEELFNKNKEEELKFLNKKEKGKELEQKKEKKNKKKKGKEKRISFEKEMKEKRLTNEKILKKMESSLEKEELQNIYLFSFDNFSEYYKKNLRAIINREQEDDKENFSKVKSINRMYKKYKRNNYYLSQRILNIYITFTNNNSKELLKTFELIKCTNNANDLEDPSSININNNNIPNKKDIEIDLNKENKKEDSMIIKNKIIDNSYFLECKSKGDQTFKEKLFGTYDMIEISNIVEDNFIMQRSFSSYTLIKYSLLNVLAVTRLIESKIINNQNVIQIICDFCDITNLPVKKYMKLYLNMFKALYQKQNGNTIEKYKIKECLKLIFSYICKENMISEEEKKKFLNDLKINLLEISPTEEAKDFKDYIKEYGSFFRIGKKLFFGTSRKTFENVLKIIESIHLGQYEDNVFKFNYESLNDIIILNDINQKFIPKTPILLYYNTNKLLKKYLTDFSNENILYNEIYSDILSLLIYFKIPIIGNKWIENSEEQSKNKNNKKNDDKKTKSNKNTKNGSNNFSINEKDKFEILGNKEKEDKSKTKQNNEIKENKSEVINEILKKIIAILFDLVSNIKKNYNFNQKNK